METFPETELHGFLSLRQGSCSCTSLIESILMRAAQQDPPEEVLSETQKG